MCLEILFPQSLGFRYLSGRGFLRFLVDAVRGNNERVRPCVPKGKKTIRVALVQGAELPNVRTVQLLEEFSVTLAQLHPVDVVHYLVAHFLRQVRR